MSFVQFISQQVPLYSIVVNPLVVVQFSPVFAYSLQEKIPRVSIDVISALFSMLIPNINF